MSVHLGECVTCGRGRTGPGIRISDDTDQCITCRRLDNIESTLGKMLENKKSAHGQES